MLRFEVRQADRYDPLANLMISNFSGVGYIIPGRSHRSAFFEPMEFDSPFGTAMFAGVPFAFSHDVDLGAGDQEV